MAKKGIVSLADAIKTAEDASLDLVQAPSELTQLSVKF